MKCAVCLVSHASFGLKPYISGNTINLCSEECYRIFAAEYKMCKLDVKLSEIEERLNDYRKKGGRKVR